MQLSIASSDKTYISYYTNEMIANLKYFQNLKPAKLNWKWQLKEKNGTLRLFDH